MSTAAAGRDPVSGSQFSGDPNMLMGGTPVRQFHSLIEEVQYHLQTAEALKKNAVPRLLDEIKAKIQDLSDLGFDCYLVEGGKPETARETAAQPQPQREPETVADLRQLRANGSAAAHVEEEEPEQPQRRAESNFCKICNMPGHNGRHHKGQFPRRRKFTAAELRAKEKIWAARRAG